MTDTLIISCDAIGCQKVGTLESNGRRPPGWLIVDLRFMWWTATTMRGQSSGTMNFCPLCGGKLMQLNGEKDGALAQHSLRLAIDDAT